jgi:hypothetical protein
MRNRGVTRGFWRKSQHRRAEGDRRTHGTDGREEERQQQCTTTVPEEGAGSVQKRQGEPKKERETEEEEREAQARISPSPCRPSPAAALRRSALLRSAAAVVAGAPPTRRCAPRHHPRDDPPPTRFPAASPLPPGFVCCGLPALRITPAPIHLRCLPLYIRPPAPASSSPTKLNFSFYNFFCNLL